MNTLKCPACAANMYATSDDNLEYERCDGCQGLWLDFGELKKIIHLNKNLAFKPGEIHRGDDQIDHEHHYDCAACNTPMEQREYAYDSGVHLDICPKCKDIFISKHDLEEMAKYMQSRNHHAQTPARQAQVTAILNEVYTKQIAKQKATKKAFDNLFRLDDIPGLNKVTEWVFGEMADVDSFPAVDDKH